MRRKGYFDSFVLGYFARTITMVRPVNIESLLAEYRGLLTERDHIALKA